MKFGRIFVGFLFLINPDLMTLDVLPDVIGFLLIASGLKQAAYLEERLESARRFAFFLALTAGLKLVATPLVFGANWESDRLTVSFCFLVAEILLTIPFTKHLFQGVQYLAVRKNGDIALKGFEVAKTIVSVFLYVKYACAFLPQLAVIFFPDVDADPDTFGNGYTAMRTSFQFTRSILFVLAAILTLTFGIYAARVLHAYLKRIRSDAVFCENLGSAYREKVTESLSMKQRIAIRSAFLWFFFAFLCLIDLYLDFLPMIPQPLFFLFVYLGMRSLHPYLCFSPVMRWIPLVGLAVNTASFLFLIFQRYQDDNFIWDFPSSVAGWILGLAGEALALTAAVVLFLAVKQTAEHYTEQSYGRYFIGLIAAAALLCFFSFHRYIFPGRSDLVPALQWIVFAISLYFHKNSLDEIRAEADYRLM